jgi:hypothetical protein
MVNQIAKITIVAAIVVTSLQSVVLAERSSGRVQAPTCTTENPVKGCTRR